MDAAIKENSPIFIQCKVHEGEALLTFLNTPSLPEGSYGSY